MRASIIGRFAKFILVAGLLLLTACGQTAPTKTSDTAPNPTPADGETGSGSPQEVSTAITVAFPYIPNVQFAPYYVAESKGYYADAGLDVTFEYMFEDEAVQLISQGNAQFGFISGISVLLARQSGIPVKTVATITQKFPVAFFSIASNYPLETFQELKNAQIGIPGRFGASYYGLLAVLYANDMEETQLNIQDIGFNQIPLITEEKIQVAVGYAVNEPVQLRHMGYEVDMLEVADIYPLASDGIITTEDFEQENPEIVQAFVRATLQGLQDTIDAPEAAFEHCLEHIPEAELGDAELQKKVLQENIGYWKAETLGYSDPTVWQNTLTFLLDRELLMQEIPLENVYTNEFVEQE
jgi:NitT/TauT family transport system substrate-binding protein